MEDYNSKYSGEQVEALLDQVASGNAGGTGEKGDKGDTGVGVQSVTQTTTSDADGGSNVVTVTLTDGTTSTFTVKNGSKGSQGEQGIQGVQGEKGEKGDAGADGTNGKDGADGEDGATFTPSVDSAGNLSWTNNKGLANPPTVNIKGPKGDAGEGGGSSSGGGKTVIEAPISGTGNIAFLRENPMQPNTIYVATEAITEGVAIRAIEPPTSFAAEYVLHLYLVDSGPSPFTLPDTVIWANGVTPSDIETGIHYELSIVASKVGNEYIYKAVLTPFK